MAVSKLSLERMLQEHFSDAEIILEDIVGDNNHYSLKIKSAVFKDKSKIDQHRLVNYALKDCLGEDLHALKIQTIIKD